ncbi:hypothetical protein NIES2119_24090 [[Phormidium ambiguum] IAM M-71]|uniref:Uncharacterized protein n=1 Tax=[Phormidium ambiguum] IAM M-71 TaxID=454136 RepID=A0A1U7I9K5_9CYAN|nr:hypothetical protein [Phormidium ambiguum]OKH33146.1 hypothetical protein NIES2119_24090 [Phormidium ambiguum IAM M-71]
MIQREICDLLIQSEYGKYLDIRSVADWQQVLIVDYDQLEPLILGKQNSQRQRILLTPEPIFL